MFGVSGKIRVRGCEHLNLVISVKRHEGGVMFAKVCQACRYLVSTTTDDSEAKEMIGEEEMPYGKYKGYKFKDIPHDYLEYLTTNFHGEFGEKASIYLYGSNKDNRRLPSLKGKLSVLIDG